MLSRDFGRDLGEIEVRVMLSFFKGEEGEELKFACSTSTWIAGMLQGLPVIPCLERSGVWSKPCGAVGVVGDSTTSSVVGSTEVWK